MIHRIDENIRVAAVFGPGKGLRPVWFDWKRKKHTITEITYTWNDRVGDITLLHFAVSDGTDLYELTYDVSGQIWTLAALDTR